MCLLWPTAAVTVKRLHDRGRSGAWAFLMIVAWMLLAGNWAILPGVWQWAVGRVTVIHRIGELWPGDEIVFVGVTSAHRSSAFEAGQFIMDYLKTRAPFWKREATPEGDRWVEARESDQQAAKRW